VGAEVVRPADQSGLAQRREVKEVSGCTVVAVVERVAAVKDVAAGNGVIAQLQVLLNDPVKVVDRLGNDAGNTGESGGWAACNSGSYAVRKG